MKNIQMIEEPRGTFSSELGVSVAEWQEILSDRQVTTDNYRRALMAFYNEPGHKSTCSALSLKYFGNGKDAQRYNAWITKFGMAVVKKLGRFHIIDRKGEECFWNVAVNPGKDLGLGRFEWTLRSELVQAIEKLGWHQKFSWIPFYMEMADKLLTFKNNRKALVDIVYSLDSQYVNYIHTDDGGHYSDIDPFTFFGIFNRGSSYEKRIKIAAFFKEQLGIEAEVPENLEGIPTVFSVMSCFCWSAYIDTDIQPLWDLFEAVLKKEQGKIEILFDKVCKQKGIKWNITMGLFWIRPYEYIALDSCNQSYLNAIGMPVFPERQLNAAHYFTFLNELKQQLGSEKLKENTIPDISYNAWQRNIEDTKHYWLAGYSFNNGNYSQLERFLKEGIWEGWFRNNSKKDKRGLTLAETIKQGDIIILKATGTKGKKHDKPFLRVKAVGIIVSDVVIKEQDDFTRCHYNVVYISTKERDFDDNNLSSYRASIHKVDKKANKIIDYVKDLLKPKDMKTSKYKEYIDLLKEAHNLVLTGAPGTGKTYMARKIAEEMGAETKFVQFHPSYDYTDFVEGLRPVDNGSGQVVFERKDGVFKEFCSRAVHNIIDSKKSPETISEEISWSERLEDFVNDAIDNETRYKTVNGSEFTVTGMNGNTILILNEQNDKTPKLAVNVQDILTLLINKVPLKYVRDIRRYFNRRYNSQPDSYAFVIVDKMRGKYKKEPHHAANHIPSEGIKEKAFVFIIDEINRGEASKIFGELFYAIDPGYRGDDKNPVQTQYQNLVTASDEFPNGFYVPKNVYILATMNDIDRSVESMDFAMRRRFTWKEISPKDTEYMLDELGQPLADEARKTMHRLNKVIEDTNGLGAAYMIGPAYFRKLKDNGGSFEKLWKMNLEPLLREYLRGFRKINETIKRFEKAFCEEEGAEGNMQESIDR